MKTERRLPDLVQDMQEAAQRVLQYTSGMNRTGFLADLRTQQAVYFNFVILGEVSARVMDRHADFAAACPEVPWRAIRNMRNQVAHGYTTIDVDLVWDTVTQSLPDLLDKLPAAFAAANRQASGDGSSTPAS